MPTPTEQILQEMYQSFLQELDKYIDQITLGTESTSPISSNNQIIHYSQRTNNKSTK